MDVKDILDVLIKHKDNPALLNPNSELYDIHLAALDAIIWLNTEYDE